mmetsp:Transcript_12440/g.36984  ORF Transcript_12440/g.36984 Transcript_12440/m.36984 type:complete len:369 (+) Transcript_12440:2332-3438(+)
MVEVIIQQQVVAPSLVRLLPKRPLENRHHAQGGPVHLALALQCDRPPRRDHRALEHAELQLFPRPGVPLARKHRPETFTDAHRQRGDLAAVVLQEVLVERLHGQLVEAAEGRVRDLELRQQQGPRDDELDARGRVLHAVDVRHEDEAAIEITQVGEPHVPQEAAAGHGRRLPRHVPVEGPRGVAVRRAQLQAHELHRLAADRQLLGKIQDLLRALQDHLVREDAADAGALPGLADARRRAGRGLRGAVVRRLRALQPLDDRVGPPVRVVRPEGDPAIHLATALLLPESVCLVILPDLPPPAAVGPNASLVRRLAKRGPAKHSAFGLYVVVVMVLLLPLQMQLLELYDHTENRVPLRAPQLHDERLLLR